MTPLRRRMIETMVVRNCAERTIECYVPLLNSPEATTKALTLRSAASVRRFVPCLTPLLLFLGRLSGQRDQPVGQTASP